MTEIETSRPSVEEALARRVRRVLPCDVEIAELATHAFSTAYSWGKRHGGHHDGRGLDDSKDVRPVDAVITEIRDGAWDDLLRKCRLWQLDYRRWEKKTSLNA
jgi:hypothetical protein